jgi:acyl-coenzyme A thioesterase PaaI-like protein
MGKYIVDREKLRKRFENQSVKYVRLAELRADVLEERHIKIAMPLKDLHINHVGTAYAGSLFVLAEVAGAYAIFSTYGDEKYVPIISGINIQYLKPSTKECFVEISLTEKEAEEWIKPIDEKGKGRFPLTSYVTDLDGVQIAKAEIMYYLMKR